MRAAPLGEAQIASFFALFVPQNYKTIRKVLENEEKPLEIERFPAVRWWRLQNSNKGVLRYRFSKISIVLSQVQKGNPGDGGSTENGVE